MKLEDLTWKEVGDYLKKKDSLIIPIGTCEQHGKHLPLNTDTYVTEKIADFLSEQTGILVAPTINYGVNFWVDKDKSGTANVDGDILTEYMASILEWWKLQGFKNFFALSAHGEPKHLEAIKKSDSNVKLISLYDLNIKDILEKQGGVYHACEGETSVMLYLMPESVQMDKAKDLDIDSDELEDYVKNPKTKGNYDGPVGFPTFATKEKGEKIFDSMKKNALSWIESE